MPRTAAVLVLTGLLIAAGAEARDPRELDRHKMGVYNVALTAFFSLVSAVVQHEVHSGTDALNHFLIGAGAGVSYYQAKRLAAGGRVTAGWLLTNATASVVENTASGEHAFGRVGYTVGPLRFRVATPLARKAIARVEADWSLTHTADLWFALQDGDHVGWRNGLITVDRDTPWPNPDDSEDGFDGMTYGVFPGISPGASEAIWNHEMIHVVQQQQLDSVEPPSCTFHKDEDDSTPHRLFAFRHVRLGFIHGLNLTTYSRRYHRRWGEIEAYALAQDSPVPIFVPSASR